MSAKVVPHPCDDSSPSKPGAGAAVDCRQRASRVFKAVNDVYEFHGWVRLWINVFLFVLMYVTAYYSYPNESGIAISTIMSKVTTYEPSPGANDADVRSVVTFEEGVNHGLGFITAYVNKATADGHIDSVPIIEYTDLLFARMEIDFETNCNPAFRKMGFACYRDGVDPTNGTQIDPDRLTALAGPDGVRQVVFMDRNMTREQTLALVSQVLGQELPFIATYAYEAVLKLGVANRLKPYYRAVVNLNVCRKDRSTHIAAYRSVVVSIDNVPVRSLPLYLVTEDHIRGFLEVGCLLLLAFGIWEEVLQFNVCRAWTELHLSDEQLSDSRAARRRMAHVTWLFFGQPWNIIDAISLLNYSAWWIVYITLVVRSYHSKPKVMETLADYDAMQSYADARFQHLVWGIFTNVLLGLRVLPWFKVHGGLRVFLNTLKLTWKGLKDLIVFFGFVYMLVVILVAPLFAVTGANTLFIDGSTSLLNIALLAFGNFGYQDYFANDAPTFGSYKTIFMVTFWFVVIILVVISQNVFLALVASAYDEAREVEGAFERTFLMLSVDRCYWILYDMWHRWVLRKTRYGLLEELLAAVRKPNAWWLEHVFVRWAVSALPEAQLLAQLYIDPASERLYLYSPWAWSRASPWDDRQMAPWDEQLGYPMYSWADVPRNNSPGVRPRLLRLPPLFTSKDGGATRERMPVLYNDADDIFALAEDEVDDLLDCVEAAWQRMRRNALVARCTSLGWSQRGRGLLREGLLEVYRRHQVDERTTSSVLVQGPAKQAQEAAGQEAHGPDGPQATVRVKSVAALGDSQRRSPPKAHQDAEPDGPKHGGDSYAAEQSVEAGTTGPAGFDEQMVSGVAAERQQRGRRMTFFNRRGRIADSLDLLWTEMSELRQQQAQMQRHQADMRQQQAQMQRHQEDMRQQQGEIKALLQALVSRQQQAPVGSPAGGRTGGSGGGLVPDRGGAASGRASSAQRLGFS